MSDPYEVPIRRINVRIFTMRTRIKQVKEEIDLVTGDKFLLTEKQITRKELLKERLKYLENYLHVLETRRLLEK